MPPSENVHASEASLPPPPRGGVLRFALTFPWRTFFLTIIVVCVSVVALLIMRSSHGVALPPASTSHIEVRPSPNVILAIHDLARLESVNYHMERVVELNDQQTHLFGLVNSRDALLLIAVGDVSAGIDLQQLRDQDVQVDWSHRAVHVRLPAAEVFTSTLDNTQTHVYARETDSLANRREDLEERARREAESTMRRAAIDGGILTRAQDSGGRAIRSLLHSLGFEQIDVTFATVHE